MAFWLAAALSIAILLLQLLWRYALRDYWLRPMLLASAIARQGIAGPPRGILLGNLKEMMRLRNEEERKDLPIGCHDIREHVLPHIFRWSAKYGVPFVHWWAYEPRIIVRDLDMIKEVLYNKAGHFRRSPLQQKFLVDLLGNGLVVVDGEEWATSRRIVSPAFHAEKIKGMARAMSSCVDSMLKKWESLAASASGFEIDACEQFTQLTADVISQTAFGSSFKAGESAFRLIQELFPLLLKANTSSWNPRLNRKIRSLKSELDTKLKSAIDNRRALRRSGQISHYGEDLLGLMLEEVDKDSGKFTDRNLVNECKTFYVAGHETTASLLTWTLMLLAINPHWQERARQEVLEACTGMDKPDADSVSKMKLVGMVLNEALRLYPPALFVVRHASRDVTLGGSLTIPEGVSVHVPILDIMQDPELWGADCHEFNPERFSGGVASACSNAFAFMPFSHGPRFCVGQAFALMEAKIAVAMILGRFSLQLSPQYRHNPVLRLSLRPQYGMPLLVTKV